MIPLGPIWRRLLLLLLAILLGLIAGCPEGPRNLDRYPDRKTSPYLLPWKAGVSWLCVQGNNGTVSHNGRGEFAYDFYMPIGTPILAARAGVVIAVKQDSRKIGKGRDNNYVRIRHDDGTVGHYLHLDTQGALVKRGQRVKQREPIARSGWTGRAVMPHLHFHVTRRGREIPVTFRDVEVDRGVPRAYRFYRAGD